MSFDPLKSLDSGQEAQLKALAELIQRWNVRLNLVSRKDEDRIWSYHVLHCLMLSWRAFPDGSLVVDWGTGGGLPALALAIRFPGVHFVGVDRIDKKIRAVRSMARSLDLGNVSAVQNSAESYDDRFDYAVSRATAEAGKLWSWTKRGLKNTGRKNEPETGPEPDVHWRPGLICLKGGNLAAEMAQLEKKYPSAIWEGFGISSLTLKAEWSDKQILHISEETDEHA